MLDWSKLTPICEVAERARREGRRSGARKEKAEGAEREMMTVEREQQHVLEMKRLELEAARIVDTSVRVDHTSAAKLPKIAPFKTARANWIVIF